jgi:uncharacterized membrane protein
MKNYFRILMGILFILAGLNHFLNPDWYLPMIPPYLPLPELLNHLSGAIEVVLGAGLLSEKYRKLSAYGIMLLMIAFVPAHIHHIQMDGCVSEQICIPVWAAWVRLLVGQPFIMLWAYLCRK